MTFSNADLSISQTCGEVKQEHKKEQTKLLFARSSFHSTHSKATTAAFSPIRIRAEDMVAVWQWLHPQCQCRCPWNHPLQTSTPRRLNELRSPSPSLPPTCDCHKCCFWIQVRKLNSQVSASACQVFPFLPIFSAAMATKSNRQS